MTPRSSTDCVSAKTPFHPVRRIDGRVTLRQHFMAFSKPQYPLGSVDAAGRVLAESVGSPMQIVDEGSLEVIKNWRAAHHFPLQIVKMMLKGRAKRIDPQALVSQRMKRLPSIQNKLIRGQSETMRLSQMQDIGGCRAVLKHISDVDRLMALFREGSKKSHWTPQDGWHAGLHCRSEGRRLSRRSLCVSLSEPVA